MNRSGAYKLYQLRLAADEGLMLRVMTYVDQSDDDRLKIAFDVSLVPKQELKKTQK